MLRRLYYTLKMLQTQWESPEEIKKRQLKRLKFIVDYAYRNTVFYHNKFKKAGIHPSDIQSLPDLKKIPITTKDEVINHREHMLVPGFSEKNSLKVTTSGSSGRMMEILQDSRSVAANEASVTRAYAAMGRRLFKDRIAYIRHISTDAAEQFQGKLVEFLTQTLGKSLWLSSSLDEEVMIEKMKVFNPTVVAGYPSSLYMLANKMKELGIEFTPRFVMSGGELLTHEDRAFIQSVFQCHVYDFYGAYELMVVAWECKKHGMHIDADMNILECLAGGEDAAPGEPGEVVGTNLWYRAMPFIRYKVGDVASFKDDLCECGRGLPLMHMVEGRKDDFLVLPSGRLVGPRAVKPLVMTFPEVDKLRIIQEKKDLILVKIVEKTEFNRTEELKQKLKDVLKEDVTVQIDIVDDIPRTTGKLRAVYSKVAT